VDRISQAQPDPHIEIAQLVQAVAVVPAFLKASPLKKDTWMAKRVAVEEEVMKPFLTRSIGLVEDPVVEVILILERASVLGDCGSIREHCTHLRVLLQICILPLKLFGFPDVVRVMNGDIAPPGAIFLIRGVTPKLPVFSGLRKMAIRGSE
jgi:hypothetical protein